MNTDLDIFVESTICFHEDHTLKQRRTLIEQRARCMRIKLAFLTRQKMTLYFTEQFVSFKVWVRVCHTNETWNKIEKFTRETFLGYFLMRNPRRKRGGSACGWPRPHTGASVPFFVYFIFQTVVMGCKKITGVSRRAGDLVRISSFPRDVILMGSSHLRSHDFGVFREIAAAWVVNHRLALESLLTRSIALQMPSYM